jgi:hypothetical protein
MDSSRKRRRKHIQDISSKRMREISDGDASRESLIVQLQVNREALSRLVASKSVQRPDVSHRESAPRDEQRDTKSGAAVQENGDGHDSTHTPPPPQENEPKQRRSSGFQAINASHDAPPATTDPAPAPAPVLSPAPISVSAAALERSVSPRSLAPAQPIDAPSQQPPLARRSSTANAAPLRIVPVEVTVVEGQPRPSSARGLPTSSDLSEQSYTTAPTSVSARSSAQSANDVAHIRDQSALPRNAEPPQPASQTTPVHHPPVQPLTSQPPAPFRDHAHGHHAFRVHRPFIPQQQHPPQHPHAHPHQSQPHHPPQHQHPQHQPAQHQLQHQFAAHPPQSLGHQQHIAQRHGIPHQHQHQHQLMPVPPRQLLPANGFPPPQQAPPVRRPSPHQILHSHVRRNAFVEVCMPRCNIRL